MSGSTLVDKVSDGQQLTDGSGSDIEIVTAVREWSYKISTLTDFKVPS